MSMRLLSIVGLLLGTLIVLAGSVRQAEATVPPPTCFDPVTLQERPATKWLTTPGTLVGTDGPDVLVGSSGNDEIRGLGGDDLICGGNGADVLEGGQGNDRINDATGNRASGGPGDDVITGFDGGLQIGFQGVAHGDTGRDWVSTFYGAAYGDAGDDIFLSAVPGDAFGGAGNDSVYVAGGGIADGGSGDDLVRGALAGVRLRGGSGSDTLANLDAQYPVDLLDGGSGADVCTPNGASTRSCEAVN